MGTITEFDGELDAELIKAIDGFSANVAESTRAVRQTLGKVELVLKSLADEETKPEKPKKWVFAVEYDGNRLKKITATEG